MRSHDILTFTSYTLFYHLILLLLLWCFIWHYPVFFTPLSFDFRVSDHYNVWRTDVKEAHIIVHLKIICCEKANLYEEDLSNPLGSHFTFLYAHSNIFECCNCSSWSLRWCQCKKWGATSLLGSIFVLYNIHPQQHRQRKHKKTILY